MNKMEKIKNTIDSNKLQILLAIFVLLAAFYISLNFYQFMLIQGESMVPAYHNLQLVILDKHTDDYTYGDVIAFRCEGLNAVLVKRIVACPGDSVIIREGILYVNGEVSTIFPSDCQFDYAGIAETEMELDTEQYFVIGDNIGESKDSRYQEVGRVDEMTILGEIIVP